MGNAKRALRTVKHALEKAYVFTYSLTHPIKKQVLFESFSGKQYSDNPRAISEKLHELYPNYTIYWRLNSAEDKYKIIPSYVRRIPQEKTGVFPFEYLKVLATSCCFVTNEALDAGLPKRKGQFFVCTWHGDRAFKKVAYDLEGFVGTLVEDELADVCIVGSDYGESQFRTAFRFSGEILKQGTPRDDVLVRNEANERTSVLKRLGLSSEYKYILYAPTFKDNKNHEAQFNAELSLSRTIDALEKRTACKWKALSRAHSAAYGGIKYSKEDASRVIDVSDYPDMSDVLLIADALITDYSSSPGDAALRNIPVFLFHNEPYTRPLYFKVEDSPFWVAHDQMELETIISAMTEDGIKENCKSILNFYGTNETGEASAIIANRINQEYIKLK